MIQIKRRKNREGGSSLKAGQFSLYTVVKGREGRVGREGREGVSIPSSGAMCHFFLYSLFFLHFLNNTYPKAKHWRGWKGREGTLLEFSKLLRRTFIRIALKLVNFVSQYDFPPFLKDERYKHYEKVYTRARLFLRQPLTLVVKLHYCSLIFQTDLDVLIFPPAVI